MKKIFLTINAFLFTSIIFWACNKEEAVTPTANSNDGTNLSQSRIVSNSIFDNHVTDMKSVKVTDLILVKFLGSAEWRNLPVALKRNANLSNVSVVSYDYSENLKVLQIPLKNNPETNIMVYTSIYSEGNVENFKYLPAISEMKQIENEIRQFKLLSIGGDEYYSMKLNSENKVGEFKLGIELPIRDIVTPTPNPNPGPDEIQTCPEKTNTFGNCMLCAINECAGDWICAVTCTVMAEPCLVGFALACALA